ncbi:FUN14 family-domain-containing protein [Cyathus striatus]|nr:FUN14 family-domain-containing protein [Cyathus striatus]
MMMMTFGSIFSVGMGLSTYFSPPVICDSPAPVTPEQPWRSESVPPPPSPTPPQSSVSLYELGFGTVTGICAGIFVKKGAKAVAWVLGGVFVLLQFLGSSSVVRVNWKEVGSRFENLFYTRNAAGESRPPSLLSLCNWLINFLTADFQPRASFIAGFALGLRIG